MENSWFDQTSAIEALINDAKGDLDVERLETLLKARMIQSSIAALAFADNGLGIAA